MRLALVLFSMIGFAQMPALVERAGEASPRACIVMKKNVRPPSGETYDFIPAKDKSSPG